MYKSLGLKSGMLSRGIQMLYDERARRENVLEWL